MVLRFSHDFVRTDRLMTVPAGPHPLADVSELPRIDHPPITTSAAWALPAVIRVACQHLAERRALVRFGHVFFLDASSLRLGRFAGVLAARAAVVTDTDDLDKRISLIDAATFA